MNLKQGVARYLNTDPSLIKSVGEWEYVYHITFNYKRRPTLVSKKKLSAAYQINLSDIILHNITWFKIANSEELSNYYIIYGDATPDDPNESFLGEIYFYNTFDCKEYLFRDAEEYNYNTDSYEELGKISEKDSEYLFNLNNSDYFERLNNIAVKFIPNCLGVGYKDMSLNCGLIVSPETVIKVAIDNHLVINDFNPDKKQLSASQLLTELAKSDRLTEKIVDKSRYNALLDLIVPDSGHISELYTPDHQPKFHPGIFDLLLDSIT